MAALLLLAFGMTAFKNHDRQLRVESTYSQTVKVAVRRLDQGNVS
jgi:hypothetical protein